MLTSVSLDSSQRRVFFFFFFFWARWDSLDLFDLEGSVDSFAVAVRNLSRTMGLSARDMPERRHCRKLSRWGYWVRRSHQSSTVFLGGSGVW